jgi:hypothetical protein
MSNFLFMIHPVSSAAESSLSTRREGEEGELIYKRKNYWYKTDLSNENYLLWCFLPQTPKGAFGL